MNTFDPQSFPVQGSGDSPARRAGQWASRLRVGACALALALQAALPAKATTPLADHPVFSNISVPGNLALALSVEYPTAISVAHTNNTFSSAQTYLGYFDPNKCYGYSYNTDEKLRHFFPDGAATNRTCTSKWSGNFLNWATMQTVDPFRWALTGGYRSLDTSTVTLLERAWASAQGGQANFPNRALGTVALVSAHTPLPWSSIQLRNWKMGNKLVFSQTAALTGVPDVTVAANAVTGVTVFNPAVTLNNTALYEVTVRVKVCDTSATAGPLEANCTAYPDGNYKPTGLLQQYANNLRYSAFGYLNDGDLERDGGVLRAKQKFVGPMRPVPNGSPVSNAAAEWSSSNGVLVINPDAADAADTATLFGVPVANSGVINYLSKFGQVSPGAFKRYDPVGELYYAAIRYFKNLGNVPEWSNFGSASTATKTTWVDGFPVITTWDDPIQYSCQRNFVLGIGDVNTHADKNVPGSGMSSANEPSRPSSLALDPVNAVAATDKVGALHGMGSSLGTTTDVGGCCNSNSALMAGLAFDANGKDIRPDNIAVPKTVGKQTIQTYWLDILEYQTYKANNQFYLAAKYGGAKLPSNFDPYTQTTDLPKSWWSTTGETVGPGGSTQDRPDNYFTADRPDQMVLGLQRAFAKIFNDLKSYTTSFATALPQTQLVGNASYGAKFDANTWTGEVETSSVSFDATTGDPTFSLQWSFKNKLTTQIAGTGWNTNRVMATWNTGTSDGVPFRHASLSTNQKTALDTIYRSGNDSADYLNYLRGDPTHEESSNASGSARIYRNRSEPVGDIGGSKVRPVGPPAAPFSNAANPGYSTFKTTWADRPPMIFVGTNAGVLHAIDGALTVTTASPIPGRELFAYVPGALYQGASGSPINDGLMSRGDPNFTHKALVDGSPIVFDIDFNRTKGSTGSPDWRSVLVGALGKGGKSYFAIDVTNPTMGIVASDTNAQAETKVADKVLWEFTDSKLGFTYGVPSAVKTRKYGWVLIFGSGYNNADGKGYFLIVNPRTGALLETVDTGVGTPSAQAGLAHVQSFILDRTDGTADAVYAGDLLGNVWRLDVTATSGDYPAPVKLAQLTNASGNAVPITVRPLVIEHPKTRVRYVTVGSGKLLDTSDIAGPDAQVFAAIMDGTGSAFGGVLPAGVSYPILRSNLAQVTNLSTGVTVSASQRGWWLDLGSSAVGGGTGWRVITESSAFNGAVSFASMLPNVDACSPSGTSRVYSIDVLSGQSELAASQAYIDVANQVIEVKNLNVAGKRRLYAGDVSGKVASTPVKPATALPLTRMNWRELPLAD